MTNHEIRIPDHNKGHFPAIASRAALGWRQSAQVSLDWQSLHLFYVWQMKDATINPPHRLNKSTENFGKVA
jgi:hypothetical protein